MKNDFLRDCKSLERMIANDIEENTLTKSLDSSNSFWYIFQ